MAETHSTNSALDTLGALLRQVQAGQRNIRTKQATMRGLLVQMPASQTATLAVFQDAILKRLGESRALMETRFDGIVAMLAAPKTGGWTVADTAIPSQPDPRPPIFRPSSRASTATSSRPANSARKPTSFPLSATSCAPKS